MRIRRGPAEAIGAIETARLLVQRIHQQHAHPELVAQPQAARHGMRQQVVTMALAAGSTVNSTSMKPLLPARTLPTDDLAAPGADGPSQVAVSENWTDLFSSILHDENSSRREKNNAQIGASFFASLAPSACNSSTNN
jgi:hypothetical protein